MRVPPVPRLWGPGMRSSDRETTDPRRPRPSKQPICLTPGVHPNSLSTPHVPNPFTVTRLPLRRIPPQSATMKLGIQLHAQSPQHCRRRLTRPLHSGGPLPPSRTKNFSKFACETVDAVLNCFRFSSFPRPPPLDYSACTPVCRRNLFIISYLAVDLPVIQPLYGCKGRCIALIRWSLSIASSPRQFASFGSKSSIQGSGCRVVLKRYGS